MPPLLPLLPLRRPTAPSTANTGLPTVELAEHRQKCLCKRRTRLRLKTRFDALVSNVAGSFLFSVLCHGYRPLGGHRDEDSRSGRKFQLHVAGRRQPIRSAPVARPALRLVTFVAPRCCFKPNIISTFEKGFSGNRATAIPACGPASFKAPGRETSNISVASIAGDGLPDVAE
jgi:hypothetical protein